jgi:hypothetical protein
MEFLLKFIVAVCLTFLSFFALVRLYELVVPQDTTHTVYVSKECVLNEVVAGSDYVFDCPSK